MLYCIVILLNVNLLSVIVPSIFILNVNVLNTVILSVVAPAPILVARYHIE
jgi:hypothetical protein